MFPGDDISALLPDHIKSLADDLKKLPEGYPKWLYGGTPSPEIYQSDLIHDVRTYLVSEDGGVLSREGLVMVVSNTCDTQPDRRDFVLVAPVFPLQERIDSSGLNGEALRNHVTDLQQNRLSPIMYLPRQGDIPDSFVDFSHISAVSSEFFFSPWVNAIGKRVASLSQKGHYFFLMKLAYHFCRAETPDVRRTQGVADIVV